MDREGSQMDLDAFAAAASGILAAFGITVLCLWLRKKLKKI